MKKLVSLVLALMLILSMGTAMAAEGEKVTIQFWHSMSGTNADSIDHMVATYNASQDAVEVVATFQGDYYTSIANAVMAIATGTGPDVIQTGSDQVRMLSDEEGVCANLLDYLDEHAPDTPLFEIGGSAEEQLATVREVASLLTRLHADDSNDEYDLTDRMEKLRAHWLRKVVRGMERTPEDIRRGLRLYRCGERADVPCILGRLAMPADDGFLTERWHYGGQRLEVALRNFFGHEHGHMLFHVAVVSQEEVRVLCYPRDAGEGLSENEAFEYIQETAEQIEKYLGLSMKVLEVRRIPGLAAFAAENDAL